MKGGITKLGSLAFASLGVTEVILPDSLVEIASYTLAFNKIENIVIPKNVTVIGSYSFLDNPLKKIVNKTGRSIDWTNVLEGYSLGESFVTGTIGSIIITAE